MRDPNQVNPVTPLERLYSDFSDPTSVALNIYYFNIESGKLHAEAIDNAMYHSGLMREVVEEVVASEYDN